LLLLLVPLGMIEPLKIVAVIVAGKGHWLSGRRPSLQPT
jgi:hypothetical protein